LVHTVLNEPPLPFNLPSCQFVQWDPFELEHRQKTGGT
jgi:hypothetical protein